jgi:hypothetical protein
VTQQTPHPKCRIHTEEKYSKVHNKHSKANAKSTVTQGGQTKHMRNWEDKRKRGIITLLLFENLSETDADSGSSPKGERENIMYFAQRIFTTRKKGIETT